MARLGKVTCSCYRCELYGRIMFILLPLERMSHIALQSFSRKCSRLTSPNPRPNQLTENHTENHTEMPGVGHSVHGKIRTTSCSVHSASVPAHLVEP